MNFNSDQRKKSRYKYEATIWHDNLFPEIFYETKMYNLSKGEYILNPIKPCIPERKFTLPSRIPLRLPAIIKIAFRLKLNGVKT